MSIPIKEISLFLFILSILIFIISVIKDQRRFLNGIYFIIVLFTLFLFVTLNYGDTAFGKTFILLCVIFSLMLVFVVPILLIFNGFRMIKNEGFRFSNLLSLLFGVLVFVGEIALASALFTQNIQSSILRFLLFALGYGVLFFSIILLAFISYSIIIGVLPKRVDYDYVVCLGAGLIDGERIGKLLGNRLLQAKKVYDRSMSSCKIIVSGGQGADEKLSEAEAMKKYLVENGVSEKDIILEDESKNTYENVLNSQAIIQKRKGRQWVAIVTSNYHVLRAMIYCRMISFPVTGIGAKTALYYWPSAMIREYVALVKEYLFIYASIYVLTGGILYFISRII